MTIYTLKNTSVILGLLIMTTSSYAYNEMSAKYACANKITQSGKYNRISHEKATDKGHWSYHVTGKVQSRRDHTSHTFSCNVRHGEVVNWHVNEAHSKKISGKDAAIAVGAGILALAAISALTKDDKKSNHKVYKQYDNYDTGGSAFDDIRYLKRECRRNLRHHIERAHGRVRSVELYSAHLNRRSLNGRGLVVFKRGGERELDYNCVYDRRGEIRDGHYQFGRY